MSDFVNGMAAFQKHKPMSKETKKLIKKNGSLADYQREMKNKKVERYTDEEVGSFYNRFQ